MRWVRFLVAVALGATISLSGGGVARADAVQSLVTAGGADAAARGTTAGIALLDRRTGRYVDNGATAHLRFGSASLVKLFIADSVLHRGPVSDADRDALQLMLRS